MAYDLVSNMQKLAERYLKVSALRLAIVLVIVAAIALRAIYVMGWVNRTNQTIAQINLCINALVDAEAAERGYLATGKESFLEQYKAALNERAEMLSKLAALVKDSPKQTERASALLARADEMVTCSASVVGMVQRNEMAEARALFASGLGTRRLAEARELAQQMLAEENGRLEERTKIAQTVCCAILAVFLLSCFAQWRYNRRLAGSMIECSKYEQLMHENQRLQAMASQREDFLAALAHDLKIPVLGSGRIFELFERGSVGLLTDQQLALVRELRVSNDAQLRLIDKLLEVYRLEHNGLPVTFEQFNLGDLVCDCGSQFSILGISKAVTVETTVPAEAVLINGDRIYLRRVLDNLLDNALKFSPEGGVIHLQLVACEDGQAVVTVADSGVGISEEGLKTLFNKFWQGPVGRNYASSIGLGLYLAKVIVEAHHGEISCHSVYGNGAVFSVKMPLLRLVPPAGDDLNSALGAGNASGEKKAS